MVEQLPVKELVVGSNPTIGACYIDFLSTTSQAVYTKNRAGEARFY